MTHKSTTKFEQCPTQKEASQLLKAIRRMMADYRGDLDNTTAGDYLDALQMFVDNQSERKVE